MLGQAWLPISMKTVVFLRLNKQNDLKPTELTVRFTSTIAFRHFLSVYSECHDYF